MALDLPKSMLRYARENARPYVESGQATFIQVDASDFTLAERFGVVVSTYDSLNHLPDQRALRRCFQCVYAVCEGHFIFDVNTRRGLRRWNDVQVDDTDEDLLIITRGLYDGHGDRAWTRIAGFLRSPGGLYERFDEVVFNTV